MKKNLNIITREKWIRHAVEILDTKLFNGDLDLYNRQYQVSIGRCPGKKLSETVFPFDGEDVSLDDFFPVTMQLSWTIKDPIELLGNLALECIHAFFDERKQTKRFKQLADKYYFDKPYSAFNPSGHLTDILEDVHNELVNNYGEFPGYPVVFHPKPKKEGKKNTLVMFCPNCSYEVKVSRKVWEGNGHGTCTCVCGTKMGIDLTDEIDGEDNTTEN
jgi:hypothetical protein